MRQSRPKGRQRRVIVVHGAVVMLLLKTVCAVNGLSTYRVPGAILRVLRRNFGIVFVLSMCVCCW